MTVNLQPFTFYSGPDAGDDVSHVFELRRGYVSVLTIPGKRCTLTLELLNASYNGKVERADLRCLYICPSGVRCWVERLLIQHTVVRVDSKTSNLMRVAGPNTFVCEPFVIEWSYSSRSSVWLYPATDTEYAVAKADQCPAPESSIRRFLRHYLQCWPGNDSRNTANPYRQIGFDTDVVVFFASASPPSRGIWTQRLPKSASVKMSIKTGSSD